MTKEDRRRELAGLSFAEKLKILERLRDRSLIIAKSRSKQNFVNEVKMIVEAKHFSGTTPKEAFNSLSTFVGNAAAALGLDLQITPTEEVPSIIYGMEAVAKNSKGSFWIDAGFQSDNYSKVQQQTNPLEKEFGHGAVTKRGGRVELDLIREPNGLFRWYAQASSLTDNVEAIIPGLAPFLLTEEWIADGLRALVE